MQQLINDVKTLYNTAEAHIEKIYALEAEVADLKERNSLPEIPEWAQEAVDAAVKASIVDQPNGGSYDFYRLITVLHRKGVV